MNTALNRYSVVRRHSIRLYKKEASEPSTQSNSKQGPMKEMKFFGMWSVLIISMIFHGSNPSELTTNMPLKPGYGNLVCQRLSCLSM